MPEKESEYWKRRKQGKRGQGDLPVTSKVIQRGFGSNRKAYRSRLVSRDFTKPNVEYRGSRKLDKDGLGEPPFKGHVVNDYGYQRDEIPPELSNHDRMMMRKELRDKRRAKDADRLLH